MIRDIKNLFELGNSDYYKPVRVGNFYGKNYIEYESNGNRENLSNEVYFQKIKHS